MRQRTSTCPAPVFPGRPIRVLIEDPQLDGGELHVLPGVEVTTCSGPTTTDDVCPLVTDGWCPLGAHDVVVNAVSGEWAPAIEAAWIADGTPAVRSAGEAPDDPAERVVHHIGAALRHLATPASQLR